MSNDTWLIIGNGEGVWSWLHIEDAAIATVAAAEQGNCDRWNGWLTPL